MIEQSKLEQLVKLFGKKLPPRHLFFATRQTESIVTPAMLKGIYCEPTLGKAFQKLEEEFKKYAETREAVQPTKAIPVTAKPVKPAPPPKVVVKKDE